MTKLKKYKLTEETCQHYRRTLRRIEALKDFGNVRKGDLGGWIEKESNLSQEGDCWVSDSARVYDDARVFGDAKIFDIAQVFNQALIYNKAKISNNSRVYGHALIRDTATISGSANIHDAMMCDNASISDFAYVSGSSVLSGNIYVGGYNQVSKTPIYQYKFKIQLIIIDNYINIGYQQFKKEEVDRIKYTDFNGRLSKSEFREIKKFIVKKLNYSLFERICNYFGRNL